VLSAFWSAIRNADASAKILVTPSHSFHPSVEDFHCGSLVDKVFLFFCVFSGLVEFGGSGDRGECLVGKVEGQCGVLGLEFLGEAADFFYGIALGAIESEREADDEGTNAALVDELGDAREGVGFVNVDGFHGVRHDSDGIGGGDADARVTIVDAKGGVGERQKIIRHKM
jgi:hypothetical protein